MRQPLDKAKCETKGSDNQIKDDKVMNNNGYEQQQ